MVSWNDLSYVIQKNTHATFNVPHITLQTDVSIIPVTAAPPAAAPPPAAPAAAPPPAAPAALAPAAPVPVPAPAAVDAFRVVEARNIIQIAAVVESVTTAVATLPRKSAASAATAATAATAAIAASRTELPRASKTSVDPVVIGMEYSDPLYNSAPRLTKHQMEITEAQRLEALMNEVYAKESGRSRGWTKTGLEQMLKARCASGGDIKELERARVSFPWKLIRDDKLASAFLDFVCICKQIRVAVWDTESKIVALYPAADPVAKPAGKTYPLYNVTINGELMFGGGSDLIKLCDSNKFVLMPPLSVLKSLSGLTLDELANVATQLGMSSVEGNKAERVAKIASFKVRSRF